MRITIDGNVGAGKTTLALEVAEWLSLSFGTVVQVFEPVEDWEREGVLQDYYSGRLSALEFQKMVLRDYVARWNAASGDWVLADRSDVGHVAMAQMVLSDKELQEYSDFAKEVQATMRSQPDIRLYLDVRPETCALRAVCRGRKAEKRLSVEWFKRTDAYQRRLVEEFSMHPVSNLQDAIATIQRFDH